MYKSKYQLFIFPDNPNDSIDSDHLRHLLTNIDFLGDVDGGEDCDNSDSLRFQTGTKFLSHICFLGCSPDIELEPQADMPYTYIEISRPTDAVAFTSGINIKTPRCASCKKDLSELPEKLMASKNLADEFSCQHCTTRIEPFQLNWRKSAFFARTKIIIGNIYESEAVPDDQLLMVLRKDTGFGWKHAYVRFA